MLTREKIWRVPESEFTFEPSALCYDSSHREVNLERTVPSIELDRASMSSNYGDHALEMKELLGAFHDQGHSFSWF